MVTIRLLAVGKLKQPEYRTMQAEYLKRLGPYAKVVVEEVAAAPFSDRTHAQAKQVEAERLRKALARYATAHVVLLTEHGKTYDSLQFARKLHELRGEVVFVLAGALGFGEGILRERCDTLSLSQLTFPHELARVILLEQLYRAAAIIHGKTYHY